jgi:hypothetical protein
MKKLRGENDIEATLQRLDRLTLDEVRATAAQTLEFVYRLVRHTRVVMDGENFTSQCHFSLDAEHSYADGNESAVSVSDALGMFQVGWRHQADTMSDYVIESVQEIVSKMNRAESALFPISNIHIDTFYAFYMFRSRETDSIDIESKKAVQFRLTTT